MQKKTSKCEYALGRCTATSDADCPKKRNKRIMTGICFKIPVVQEE